MQQAYKLSFLQKIIQSQKVKLDVDFCLRLGANFPIIYDLFSQLYPNEDFEKQLENLCKILFIHYNERSEELKKIDIERVKNPDWLLSNNWIGMMLYVNHFSGNLKNFENKIPYLKDLGVNLVHLMPIMDVSENENDGGYSVRNYREVQANLGTIDDLENLSKKLHTEGMAIVLDFVLNHCADEHDWAIKAKNGNEKYKKYFYFHKDRTIPDQFDRELTDVFPQNAPGNFTYIPEINEWVMTIFHHYQWDLNYRNPEVFIEMMDILLFLANKGVDIFRLDAVAFMWKELGTNGLNLPQVHSLLQLIKLCGKIVAPSVAYIAEAIVRPNEIIKYFGENQFQADECDIAYNATFMALCWEALATQNVSLLKISMQNIPKKPLRTTWINYIRCHDDIGLGFEDDFVYSLGKEAHLHRKFLLEFYCYNSPNSWAKGLPFMSNPTNGDARISGSMASLCGLEKAIASKDNYEIVLAVSRINLLHSIILSYGGLPIIYSGDEIGTINDYSFENKLDKKHDNRWVHRPIMNWEKAEFRNDKKTIEYKIFQNLKHLIEIRKKETLFSDYNSIAFEESFDERVLCFLRWNRNNERILVIQNFTSDTIELKYAIFSKLNWEKQFAKDIVSEIEYSTEKVNLKPYGFLWLKE